MQLHQKLSNCGSRFIPSCFSSKTGQFIISCRIPPPLRAFMPRHDRPNFEGDSNGQLFRYFILMTRAVSKHKKSENDGLAENPIFASIPRFLKKLSDIVFPKSSRFFMKLCMEATSVYVWKMKRVIRE